MHEGELFPNYGGKMAADQLLLRGFGANDSFPWISLASSGLASISVWRKGYEEAKEWPSLPREPAFSAQFSFSSKSDIFHEKQSI